MVRISLREYLMLSHSVERPTLSQETKNGVPGDYPSLKINKALGANVARSRGHSKFKAERTEFAGVWFDSKAEARRYGELLVLQRAGEIGKIERQPVFQFEIGGERMFVYRADFSYETRSGEAVVEDVKGVRTPVYKLKKKIIEKAKGVRITEVTYK